MTTWKEMPFDLKFNGTVIKHFNSVDNGISWIRSNVDKVLPIAEFLPTRFKQNLRNTWQQVENEIQSLQRNNPDHLRAPGFIGNLGAAAGNFFDRFNSQEYPDINKLLSISTNYDNEAAAAYWALFSNLSWERPFNPMAFMGYYLAAVDTDQIDPTELAQQSSTDTESRTITDAKFEFENWFATNQSNVDVLVNKLRLSTESIQGYQSEASNWLKSFKKSAVDDRDRIIREGRTEFENITATYDNDLALQAPTTYWRKRAEYHRRKDRHYGVALSIAIAVSVTTVLCLSALLIFPFESALFSMLTFGQHETPSAISKVAGFTAILALIYWTLRIINRNLLSNQHIAADAEERRIMVMTYLALLRRGKFENTDVQDVIISSLFRPGTDGLVKEDYGPNPPLLDLLDMARK